MLESVPKRIKNLDDQILILKDELEELMILLVDEKKNSDVLRTWLYESYGSKDKIIDYIGFYKPLNLLQHPKMVKSVEQIWYGIYDIAQANKLDMNYMLPYHPLKFSEVHGLTGDQVYSLFLPNHLFGVFKYPVQAVIRNFRIIRGNH